MGSNCKVLSLKHEDLSVPIKIRQVYITNLSTGETDKRMAGAHGIDSAIGSEPLSQKIR